MGLAIRMAVTVTPPVLIGVLVWWGVMLAGPVVLISRWRRRRHPAPRRRLWPPAARRSAPSASSAAGSAGGDIARGRVTVGPVAPTDANNAGQPSIGALAQLDQARYRQGGSKGRAPAVGLSAETLEPLCRYVDFRRRLELAVIELERRLSGLPTNRWRIEPYPLTGERRNTLLLLGETGVFVISATYAPGHWDDVVAVSKLARKVQLLLPGYTGKVAAGDLPPVLVLPAAALAPSRRGWRVGGSMGGRWRLGDRVARALRRRARHSAPPTSSASTSSRSPTG